MAKKTAPSKKTAPVKTKAPGSSKTKALSKKDKALKVKSLTCLLKNIINFG